MMHVETFYDSQTSTFTYVVTDTSTNKCAVIDSVLDYDQYAGRFSTESADKVINYIQKNNLENEWILETHIHADHITAAFYLKKHIGGKTAIGSKITDVLKLWVPIFETEKDTPVSGKQFDILLDDGAAFSIGNLTATVIHTPGHTPACVSYSIYDAVFVGDTLFAPNRGTARADFPGGNASDLYESIQKLYQFSDDTKVYLCHDYPDANESAICQTTVAEQKQLNKMIKSETKKQDYILMREARDKTLSVPKLILPSIQTNLRLGHFGTESDNGVQYIKIPVNQL